MALFRKRTSFRDELPPRAFSQPSLSAATEASGVGGPPQLKRKSAVDLEGPPDLKRLSVRSDRDDTEAVSPLLLSSLDDKCLLRIFSMVPGRDCGMLACVNRTCRRLAAEERLWKLLCRRDWGLSLPRDSALQQTTYRRGYISWYRDYRQYGKLASRARIAWWVIETWTMRNIPAIRATLRPGASEEELERAETTLGVRFPPAFRVLYRMHDGQELPLDAAADKSGECCLNSPATLHGLFGGYSYYDQIVSLRMLPLQRLVLWTQRLREQVLKTKAADTRVVFTGSFNLKKMMVVCCTSGSVKACLSDKSKVHSAVPDDPVPGARDGMLRWLEEYAKRLKEGLYAVEVQPHGQIDLGIPRTPSISLFPMKPPVWTWAITKGVHVRVTTVFVPEFTRAISVMPDGSEKPPRFFFAYSTRLALLSEKEQRECGVAEPLQQIQLKSRHWLVRNTHGKKVDEVHGEGVVGANPVLRAGGEAFTYQSCTTQERLPVVMSGEFTFAKGSIADASAPTFTAKIPHVLLKLPPYIF